MRSEACLPGQHPALTLPVPPPQWLCWLNPLCLLLLCWSACAIGLPAATRSKSAPAETVACLHFPGCLGNMGYLNTCYACCARSSV